MRDEYDFSNGRRGAFLPMKGQRMTAHVVAILDRSGSMNSMREDAIGGFNAFLREQQELPGEADFTLVQFDHEYDVVHARRALREVKPLTSETYVPRGNTALLDAIGRTLAQQRMALGDSARVVVVVLTDGRENASREYTREAVRAAIEQCERNGWRFVFLAANQDAFASAGAMGMHLNSVSNMRNTGAGIRQGFGYASVSTQTYRAEAEKAVMDWHELDKKLADIPKADAPDVKP